MRQRGLTRYRVPLVLSGLVLACAAFIAWDRRHATSDELEARRQNVFRAFHRERVDRIEVVRGAERYELRREREDWFVVVNGQRRPADAIEAERLLSEIEGAEPQRALGTLDGASRTRFGFDRPRARVSVYEGRELTARFALGGNVEQEEAVYVEASAMTGGGDDRAQAMVLPKTFGQPFDRPSVELRDRKVAEVDIERVARVAFTVDGHERVLERRGPVWHLTTPALGRASRGAVDSVTSELHDLRATRVVADDADAAALARYGLDAPALRIAITRNGAGVEPVVLRVGRACPEHDDEYTATREGTGTVVCLARSFVDGFKAPPEGFRDDHLVSARTDEVSEVRVRGAGADGADLVLKHEGGAWRAEGSPWTVEAEAVEAWLTSLHDLTTPARLDGDVRAAHGLAPAQATLEVRRTGVEGVERILVGTSDAEGLYVSRDDEPVVMRFAPSAAETLRVEAIRFRPRLVIDDVEDQLRGLLIDVGAVHEEIARVDGVLRMARPVEILADPALTTDLARTLSALTATRWVTATSRPEFGLAQPRARLVARFEGAGAQADGGSDAAAAVRSYTLSLGAAVPGGGVYAALDGTPGVFVLPREFYEQVTTPHVDRGALRISREGVTRMSITVNAPTPSRVTLTRDGSAWRTDSGAAADGARVDALLNELSSTTAVRVFGYGPAPVEARMAAPSMVLDFAGDGDAGQQTLRVLVGERFGAGEGAGFYARREGLDATLSLPERLVESLRDFRP